MAKVIIGIHGLGNKPAKEILRDWWLRSIREGLARAGYRGKLPEFELVYWADIPHEKPQDLSLTDKEDPLYVEEKYAPSPPDFIATEHAIRKKVIDFIKSEMDKIFLNEDYSINYSFITDVILHRFFRDLESYYSGNYSDNSPSLPNHTPTIRDRIRERAGTVLQEHKNDEILFIAHSMGTIIAYDVLTLLLPDLPVSTFITIGSPLGLPIVKSKIAYENRHLLKDFRKLKTPPGVMKWYNFSDIEDYVAINYDLADDFSANERGVIVRDFIVNNDYRINDHKNPHKSFGYLRTPELASVIREFLLAGKFRPAENLLSLIQKIANKIPTYRSGKI